MTLGRQIVILALMASCGLSASVSAEDPTSAVTDSATTQPATSLEERIAEIQKKLDSLPADSPERMKLVTERMELRRQLKKPEPQATTEPVQQSQRPGVPESVMAALREKRVMRTIRKGNATVRGAMKMSEAEVQRTAAELRMRFPRGVCVCPACKGKGQFVTTTQIPTGEFMGRAIGGGIDRSVDNCRRCKGIGFVESQFDEYSTIVAPLVQQLRQTMKVRPADTQGTPEKLQTIARSDSMARFLQLAVPSFVDDQGYDRPSGVLATVQSCDAVLEAKRLAIPDSWKKLKSAAENYANATSLYKEARKFSVTGRRFDCDDAPLKDAESSLRYGDMALEEALKLMESRD